MDPLSVSVNAAGLLSLVKDVTELLETYREGAKSPPAETQRILEELKPLADTLQKMKDFLETEEINAVFSTVSSLCIIIDICREFIEKLYKKLARLRRTDISQAPKLGNFEWPFPEEEGIEIADRFKQCAQVFKFSQRVEYCGLLAKIPVDLEAQIEILRPAMPFVPQVLKLVEEINNTIDIIAVYGPPEETRKLLAIRKAEEERKRRLLKTLTPLDPWIRHRDMKARRLEGTSKWLLENERFKKWRDSTKGDGSGRVFLLSGVSGGGKTMASCGVIDDILQERCGEESNNACVCLYGDIRDRDKQTMLNILGSLAKQFLMALPEVPEEVLTMLEDLEKEERKVEAKDTLHILRTTVQSFNDIFVCIDGLDGLETRTRAELLDLLQGSELGTARLFLTANNNVKEDVEGEIIKRFKTVQKFPVSCNPDDLRIVLDDIFRKDPNPAFNDTLLGEVVKETFKHCNGSYLAPMFQLRMILQETTIAKRRKALHVMPTDKDGAYADMVQRVRESPKGRAELGVQVVAWLHLANRPLSIKETGHVLAVEKGDPELDEDNIPSLRTMLDCCVGTVYIDHETGTCRLIHWDFDEWLKEFGLRSYPDRNDIAGETCLTYLNFGDLRKRAGSMEELLGWLERYAFLNYIACHWGFYSRLQLNEHNKGLLLNFLKLDLEFNPHCGVQLLYRSLQTGERREHLAQKFSAIHALAYFGMDDFIKNNPDLPGKEKWNAPDDDGRTPLSYAAEYGREAVVRLLLERENVDVNVTDKEGKTPLSRAAANGHTAIVNLLKARAR